MGQRRFTRSGRDCKIAGICGGFAEYYDKDPTLIRVLAVALFLIVSPIVFWIYIILWIVAPKQY